MHLDGLALDRVRAVEHVFHVTDALVFRSRLVYDINAVVSVLHFHQPERRDVQHPHLQPLDNFGDMPLKAEIRTSDSTPPLVAMIHIAALQPYSLAEGRTPALDSVYSAIGIETYFAFGLEL